jgi:hypothetical protein
MTNEERTALEWRISEGLAQLGYMDVWRPADHCPQGHDNWDPDLGEPVAEIGALCGECVTAWREQEAADPAAVQAHREALQATGQWDGPPDTVADDPPAFADYLLTTVALFHDQDPTWHPEWRIPKAPKRWTQDFEALAAALDWCFRERQWNWEMASEWPVDGSGPLRMAVVQAMPRDRIGTWSAAPNEASREEVLARALAMALDAEGEA